MNNLRAAGRVAVAVLFACLLATGAASSCGKGTGGQRAIYHFGQNPPLGYVWSCHKRNRQGICVIYVRYENVGS